MDGEMFDEKENEGEKGLAVKKVKMDGGKVVEKFDVFEKRGGFIIGGEGSSEDEDDNKIRIGDLVIVQCFRTEYKEMYVRSGEKFQCRNGLYFLDDFIGKEFGSKITSRCKKKGTVFALKPTPMLHEKSISFRTQILYDFDIANILFLLEIKSGDIVVESGTGSGMLSTSIAQQVSPKGKLYTFEYDKDRYEKAQKEFKNNKLDTIIHTFHRDAYKEGFSDICKKGSVDAVFLDLPQPWLCIDEAFTILKKGKRVCTFSPCIEQTQRTVKKMSSLNFTNIRTFEFVKKPYFFERVKMLELDPKMKNPQKKKGNDKMGHFLIGENEIKGHTGYLTFATKL